MIWTRLLQRLKRSQVRHAFEKQRPALQQQFLLALHNSDGATTWHDLEWITEPVIFVRHDRVEPHYALVGISSFASPAGKTLPRPQAGTAVFRFLNGAWETSGQLLPNLTPAEALEKLMHQFMQPG